jgi:hypothetical protein
VVRIRVRVTCAEQNKAGLSAGAGRNGGRGERGKEAGSGESPRAGLYKWLKQMMSSSRSVACFVAGGDARGDIEGRGVMYATCLFCNKSLGANESFETFPVGKRLAFDAAKGRLWVVCPHCERWNLSPLDERWEAIEQAERYYRDTRKRVATDNIGLAKLRDGTTIVRIGEPLRPEFAAWRYGDQFGRRRRNQFLIAGAGVTVLAGVVVGGMFAAGTIGSGAWAIARAGQFLVRGNPEGVVAKIPTDRHGLVSVRRRHLGETTIDRAPDGTMGVNLRFKNGSARFEGREAERIAAIVIPKVNRFGGTKQAITNAVNEIEATGGSEGYLEQLSKVSHVYTKPYIPPKSRWKSRQHDQYSKHGLFGLPPEHRLALEMALHEEVERRAMTGELAELERAWQSAEEVANIADSLLVSPSVDEQYKKLKG